MDENNGMESQCGNPRKVEERTHSCTSELTQGVFTLAA